MEPFGKLIVEVIGGVTPLEGHVDVTILLLVASQFMEVGLPPCNRLRADQVGHPSTCNRLWWRQALRWLVLKMQADKHTIAEGTAASHMSG